MILFWWPKDFTFVCPTEIIEFDNSFAELQSKNTLLVGASTDTEYVHLAWRMQHPGLRDLQMPMLADTNKSLANALGILDEDESVAYRATFIIDPNGIIKWICVNDMNVGRNVHEVLRVLDALQTGEKTPCNWQKGQSTL
jgi:peroxiredoxin (alkyl hydroperoxide reductase subunit C)